jgi:hypothetical protein
VRFLTFVAILFAVGLPVSAQIGGREVPGGRTTDDRALHLTSPARDSEDR